MSSAMSIMALSRRAAAAVGEIGIDPADIAVAAAIDEVEIAARAVAEQQRRQSARSSRITASLTLSCGMLVRISAMTSGSPSLCCRAVLRLLGGEHIGGRVLGCAGASPSLAR